MDAWNTVAGVEEEMVVGGEAPGWQEGSCWRDLGQRYEAITGE